MAGHDGLEHRICYGTACAVPPRPTIENALTHRVSAPGAHISGFQSRPCDLQNGAERASLGANRQGGEPMRKAATILGCLMLSACATKQYGRLAPVSAFEMTGYTCREIALELSKVDAFDQQVREQAGFDGRSALGVLGDFGIGNSMAKGGAEKSSIERRRQLQMLAAQKGCGAAPAPPAPVSG